MDADHETRLLEFRKWLDDRCPGNVEEAVAELFGIADDLSVVLAAYKRVVGSMPFCVSDNFTHEERAANDRLRGVDEDDE